MRFSILFTIALLNTSFSQERLELSRQKELFGCWSHASFKNAHDRVATQKLLSPNKKLIAEVEVFAKALPVPADDEMGDCQNQSKLTVGLMGTVFDSKDSAQGLEQTNGNQIQLITWTSDSRYLIADYLQWAWFSEGWSHNLLIFDTVSKQLTVASPYKDLLPKFKKECDFDGQFIGVNPEGVVFEMRPAGSFDIDDCISKPEWWSFSLLRKQWTRSSTKPPAAIHGSAVRLNQ